MFKWRTAVPTGLLLSIILLGLPAHAQQSASGSAFRSPFCELFTTEEGMVEDLVSDQKRQRAEVKEGLQQFADDLKSLFSKKHAKIGVSPNLRDKPRLFIKYDLGAGHRYFQSKAIRSQLDYEFGRIFEDAFEIIPEEEVIDTLKRRGGYSTKNPSFRSADFYRRGLHNDSHGVVVFRIKDVRLSGRGESSISGNYNIKGKMKIHAEFSTFSSSRPIKKKHSVSLDRSGTQLERELLERAQGRDQSPNTALVYDLFIRGVCDMRDVVPKNTGSSRR